MPNYPKSRIQQGGSLLLGLEYDVRLKTNDKYRQKKTKIFETTVSEPLRP